MVRSEVPSTLYPNKYGPYAYLGMLGTADNQITISDYGTVT
jgi:hypothetical protein